MSSSNLSPTQELVLSKFDIAKATRAQIQPGDYAEHFYVRVDGAVKVGKDYESEVAQSVPWQQLCGYLLTKVNGQTRDKLVREFAEAWKATGGEVEVQDGQVSGEAEAAIKAILGSTKKTCSGKVTGTCVVQVVTVEQLEVAA